MVSLQGIEIGRWQTEGNCLLAVSTEAHPPAAPRRERAGAGLRRSSALDSPALEDEALAAGYSVVDQGTVIGTHLAELIRKRAGTAGARETSGCWIR